MPPVVVSMDIAAAPEDVYALVADLPGMGRWSPENRGGKWLDGATEARVGARFRGHNRHGIAFWTTTCRIITAEPGREIAWEVSAGGLPVSTWRYRFAPTTDGGTQVLESTEDRRGRLLKWSAPWTIGIADRDKRNQETMQATLERLKAAAEGATSS
jgi:uncharacterized protein YndB with AHSA1/START domain